jgi:hypothetical protein
MRLDGGMNLEKNGRPKGGFADDREIETVDS